MSEQDGTPVDEGAATDQPNVDWQGKYNGQLKVNRDLEAKLADQRAESERLNHALQEAAGRVSALEVDVTRWQTGVTHGLTADDVETFLTAGDAESLTRQGERLAARLGATTSTQPPTPAPDRTQGASNGAETRKGDPLEEALRSSLGMI